MRAEIRRLHSNPPLVRRPRLRLARQRQTAFVDGVHVQPAARVDRGISLDRLGRDDRRHLRLATAVPAIGIEPVQPARRVLLDAHGLVGMGPPEHLLAAAVRHALQALRRHDRAADQAAEPGRAPGECGSALPHRDGAIRRRPARTLPRRCSC
jgi:hypothetical protein